MLFLSKKTENPKIDFKIRISANLDKNNIFLLFGFQKNKKELIFYFLFFIIFVQILKQKRNDYKNTRRNSLKKINKRG